MGFVGTAIKVAQGVGSVTGSPEAPASPQRPEGPPESKTTTMQEVPEDVLSLLKIREGYSTEVYKDTAGFPTAGIGHKLLESEIEEYPVGSHVPEEILMHWLAQDSAGAYGAAVEQAAELKITDVHFIAVLTSVNFQLGVHWREKFVSTWHLLMTGQWALAAKHIETSLWAKQTPVRAKDFISAIQSQINLPENGTPNIF